jgi:EH domain-containing protein 1
MNEEVVSMGNNNMKKRKAPSHSFAASIRNSIIGTLSRKKHIQHADVLETVSDGLKKIYKQKLLPLEEHYKFHDFHSPALDDPDFTAKPMILLVGQYSTGKTTFIRYLLEQDFPGIRIGPEPTTDRFIAVMYGDEEGVVPGNALVVDANKQFRALTRFGNAFLNRFQCSSLKNEVLSSVTIVDTPGILSGEKQRLDRGYDFSGVLEWFAERVDRIILLFDAHKLDISDEFKRCIEALSGNEDKIRIVLNKSDMVDHQQLMRVYGALMWSLGKVFKTPEVSRVYIGSFWDEPLHYDINRRLFQDEQHDLFSDLQSLPRNAALRKLNDLIKRARLAKVHAYIIAELRKGMPSMIGKEKKKKELIAKLDKIYEQLQREHNISPGDFPDVNKMREHLQNADFTKFNPIKPKLLEVVDSMLSTDIARLMAQIPKEEAIQEANGLAPKERETVKGGAFDRASEAETPFGFGKGEGFDKGRDESEWVVSRERFKFDEQFDSLNPVDGKVNGRTAKEHMLKSKLPNSVLGKIWKLADVDKDGFLDADEFALANYLINLKLEGHELPNDLPKHLIPPGKKDLESSEGVYPQLED